MPVIYELNGMKIYIYSNDHLPMHVHVVGRGCLAKFKIEPVECYYCRGFSRRDINRLSKWFETIRSELILKWKVIHDEENKD